MNQGKTKQRIDLLINKIISRKLFVFLIFTLAFFLERLSEESWIIIASVYIGGESVIDMVDRYSKKNNNNE